MARFASQLQYPGKAKPRIALTVNMGSVGCLGDSAATIRQFVQLVGEHHLDTTWVVGHACQLSWVATLQNSSTRHDLAINLSWATPKMSRSEFQQQFHEQWEACEQVGVEPKTVYSSTPNFLRQRLRHMAQYGMMVCIIGLPDKARRGRRWQKGISECIPRPLPLGLWQLPTTEQIPSQRSWYHSTLAQRLPGTRRNQSSAGDMHVLIGAEQVIESRGSGLKQIDHFLSKVAWASSADRLDVMTATEWATSMAYHATSTPQRSILRIAA